MSKKSPGNIVTFYSYKGGVGRSMALAHVAWILASNGKRVLTLDWDLEAPGLHRYFAPFLSDVELTATPGVIDFAIEFADAAMTPSDDDDPEWFLPYANILRFAIPLNSSFPNEGRLDFIPAGRQSSSYHSRVNSFNWQSFYERMGGGALLEAARERMQEEYDFVLIDSRTGVSDTAGICTVQMPDTLVLLFTGNNQSIRGAAAVAESVCEQAHRESESLRPKRVIPVLSRTDLNEKERLDFASSKAAKLFFDIGQRGTREIQQLYEDAGDAARVQNMDAIPRSLLERPAMEELLTIPYVPFYAYEELLAVFKEQPWEDKTLLAAMQRLTKTISSESVSQLVPPEKEACEAALLGYAKRVRIGEEEASQGAGIELDEFSWGPPPSLEADTVEIADTATSRRGKIVTFYAYKGGTGRTMALANVALILANSGKRVLAVDWDLESPGLHFYFAPFLSDKELRKTDGLIEFVTEFVAVAANRDDGQSGVGPELYERKAEQLRAVMLDCRFRRPGKLDFIGAGRQDATYAARVNTFDWQSFYGELGGDKLLEAVRRRLRAEYDYILIDSRTGVSDTFGICTLLMPDTVVMFVTPNNQSLLGGAAVANSLAMPIDETAETALQIIPVFSRADRNELERLEERRKYAKELFASILQRLGSDYRDKGWSKTETLYVPFYAYEESLAFCEDKPGEPDTVLRSMEAIAEFISGEDLIGKGVYEVSSRPRETLEARRVEAPSRRMVGGMIVTELYLIQRRLGYLPEVELRALAERMQTPLYRLQEVSSFYPAFRRAPPPDVEVKVCRDMVCRRRGSCELLAKLQSIYMGESPQRLTIEGVSCLGRCDRAPAVCIDSGATTRNYLQRSLDELSEIVRETLDGRPPQHDPDSLFRRQSQEPWKIDIYASDLPLEPYASVRRFIASGQDDKQRDVQRDRIIRSLETSGLLGMGGAGARAYKKWGDVRTAAGDVKYVVCNGNGGGEPGSFKDRELLLRVPHLVVEGVILAGLFLNAERGYIYIGREYHEQIEAVREAIHEAENRHLCGDDVLGSGIDFPVEVFVSPGGYICGEQTALIEALEDKRAEPRNRPPELQTNGLWDKPTLINNVETLAWVPAIVLREDGKWFAGEGRGKYFGRRFFSISGDVARPGVYEVPVGITLCELIYDFAGGMRYRQKIKAVALSGPSGGFWPVQVPVEYLGKAFVKDLPAGTTHFDILNMEMDIAQARKMKVMMGPGIIVFGDKADMVAQSLSCLEFFRNESCGKCAPCRFGTQKLVDIATDLYEGRLDRSSLNADDRSSGKQQLVDLLAETMELGSICGLGTVAANPLMSLLTHFQDDVQQYLNSRASLP